MEIGESYYRLDSFLRLSNKAISMGQFAHSIILTVCHGKCGPSRSEVNGKWIIAVTFWSVVVQVTVWSDRLKKSTQRHGCQFKHTETHVQPRCTSLKSRRSLKPVKIVLHKLGSSKVFAKNRRALKTRNLIESLKLVCINQGIVYMFNGDSVPS